MLYPLTQKQKVPYFVAFLIQVKGLVTSKDF